MKYSAITALVWLFVTCPSWATPLGVGDEGEDFCSRMTQPGASASETQGEEQAGDLRALVQGNTNFSLALFDEIKGDKGNLFFSPYSISTALAMTYGGARGETASGMVEALQLGLDGERLHEAFGALQAEVGCRQGRAYELVTANALWGQEGFAFAPNFLSIVNDNYHAIVRTLDFQGDVEASRHTINDWVERQTKERIKDLIQPGVLSNMTRLVLTNAIYYKGAWINQFTPEATSPADFLLLSGETAAVPTMHGRDRFGYMEEADVQVLDMPFRASEDSVSSDQSMMILLPKGPADLAALEDSLTSERLASIRASLETKYIDVALPKFKFTSALKLRDALVALGMGAAFANQADFSGLVEQGNPQFQLSDVIHKAFIDVNEQGAEAAAATASVIEVTSAPVVEAVFQANRPFLFVISDTKTNSTLFMGRVVDPR